MEYRKAVRDAFKDFCWSAGVDGIAELMTGLESVKVTADRIRKLGVKTMGDAYTLGYAAAIRLHVEFSDLGSLTSDVSIQEIIEDELQGPVEVLLEKHKDLRWGKARVKVLRADAFELRILALRSLLDSKAEVRVDKEKLKRAQRIKNEIERSKDAFKGSVYLSDDEAKKEYEEIVAEANKDYNTVNGERKEISKGLLRLLCEIKKLKAQRKDSPLGYLASQLCFDAMAEWKVKHGDLFGAYIASVIQL